jgi:hypothetical protein
VGGWLNATGAGAYPGILLHRDRPRVRLNLTFRRAEMRYDVTGIRIGDFDIVRAVRPVIDDDSNCPFRRTQRRKPVGDDLDSIGQMHTVRHLPRLANAHHRVPPHALIELTVVVATGARDRRQVSSRRTIGGPDNGCPARGTQAAQRVTDTLEATPTSAVAYVA